MIEDLASLKTATIGRGLPSARDEYRRESATFAANLSRQDGTILNIVRTCDVALKTDQHLFHCEHFGVRRSASEVLMIVSKLPRLNEERPEVGLPRRCAGAIKCLTPNYLLT